MHDRRLLCFRCSHSLHLYTAADVNSQSNLPIPTLRGSRKPFPTNISMDTEVKVLLLVLFAVFTACFSFYQGNELHRLSNVLDVMAFNRGTGAEKLYRSYIVSREASKSGELCFTPASNAKLTWTMTGSNLFWAFCLTFGAFMAVVVICANSDRAKAIMNSSLSALTRFLEVYFPNQEIQRQVAAIQAQLTERYEAGYEAGREAVEDSSARQIRDTEAERELFREEAYALRRIETRLLQKVGALEKELVEEKGAKCNVCDKDKKWVIDKFQTNYDAANQEIERLEEEKKDLQNELSRASNYLSQEQRKAYQAEKDAREQKESADKEHKEFLKMEKDLARVRALAGSLISVEEQNKQLVQLTPQLEVVENMNRTQQTTINHMQAIIYNLLPGNQESRITWLETELEKAKKIGDWRHNECVRQHGDIWVSDGDYQRK